VRGGGAKWKKQRNKKKSKITKRAKLYAQKQIDKYKPIQKNTATIEEENGERKNTDEDNESYEDGRFSISLQKILLNNTASEVQISRRSCYVIQQTSISLQRILLNYTASEVPAGSFSQSIL